MAIINYTGTAFSNKMSQADSEMRSLVDLFTDNRRKWTLIQLDSHYNEMVRFKMRLARLVRTGVWRTKEQEKDHNERVRKRVRDDISLRIKSSVSALINYHIKKDHTSTKTILNDYLGYSVDELMCHLESLFNNKMEWSNYGTYWHIDHITPASWFKYKSFDDQQFIECWSLQNLQPFEASKNMSKGNRYSG